MLLSTIQQICNLLILKVNTVVLYNYQSYFASLRTPKYQLRLHNPLRFLVPKTL